MSENKRADAEWSSWAKPASAGIHVYQFRYQGSQSAEERALPWWSRVLYRVGDLCHRVANKGLR